MKRVCSWCGVVMSVGSTSDAIITHSICEQCVKKIEKQMADREPAREPATGDK